MDIALIIVFLSLGIFLFILEIFFLPGITIGGVAGTIFTICGVWYAFAKMGATAGWITIAIGLICFIILLFVFIKSKTLDKISLKKELSENESLYDMNNVNIGDKGKTISRLAPMGKVMINNNEYEAKSRDILIDQNSEVEIIGIEGQTLVVKKI